MTISTLKNIVNLYRKGIFTESETICRLAHCANDVEVDELMVYVPTELQRNLNDYIQSYNHGNMIFIGGDMAVSEESLKKLKEWFTENQIE